MSKKQPKRYKIIYIYDKYKNYDDSEYYMSTGYKCPVCRVDHKFNTDGMPDKFCSNCGVGLTNRGKDRTNIYNR